MNYIIKLKNNSSKFHLRCFCILCMFYSNFLSASSLENNFNIFFSDNNMYIEKNSYLISNPYKIKTDNYYNALEVTSGPEICKSIFSISNNALIIKDPKKNLKTYIDCKIILINTNSKSSIEYQFGVNRTFKSWCVNRDQYENEIQKTIDAVLNAIQAKDCKEDSIKESLINARMLNLAGNKLSDLSPLGGLTKLRALWLDNNQVDNLKPISTLSSLIVLSLSNNHISDIQVLSKFKDLQWLFLSKNQIAKVDYLINLEKIKVLSIKNNNIDNAKPLLQFNPNTLILANGNPFLKNICKDYIDNKLGLKQIIWLEKICKTDGYKKSIVTSPI